MTIKLREQVLTPGGSPGWVVDSGLEIFHFPGGEPHVRERSTPHRAAYAQIAVTQATNADDLLSLAMWADLVRERGEEVWIAMPYLPAARADRGHPLGAEVVSNFIINNIQPDRLVAIDPHSPFIVNRLGSVLRVVPTGPIVQRATRGVEYDSVLAPDEGSKARALEAASALDVRLHFGTKKRDFATGKLSGFGLDDPPLFPERGRVLLVDDICDGGGTFIGLAEAVHDLAPDVQLDLWVTHGIFSKGFDDLFEHFEKIYTTDSFFNAENYPYLPTGYLGNRIIVTPLIVDLSGAFTK